MAQVLDMRIIRYLNLFEKITGVRTNNCFFYNQQIIFVVPSRLVSKAIGEGGRNVKNIYAVLGRKIKILSTPYSYQDTTKFIAEVISPANFQNIKVSKDEIVITAARQEKAILIGRNKTKLLELEKITREFLKREVRIA